MLGVVEQLRQNHSTIAQFVLSWLQQYVSIIATETCLDGTSLQRVIWWSCLCAWGRKLAEEHGIIFLFLSAYRQSITADMLFDNKDWRGVFLCIFARLHVWKFEAWNWPTKIHGRWCESVLLYILSRGCGPKNVFKQLIMRIAHTRTHKQWRNDFLGERDCV